MTRTLLLAMPVPIAALFRGFQSTLTGDQVPQPAEPCTITFAAMVAGGAPAEIAAFCYRDGAVTRGACPG